MMASLAAHCRHNSTVLHKKVLDPGETGGAWVRTSMPMQSSPTLARVHRATLRLEGLLPHGNDRASFNALDDDTWTQIGSLNSSVQSCGEASPGAAIKRGNLLTLRPGAIFRRWKERYFLLTSDYLSCFKLVSGGPSHMGPFIYKVRLAEVCNVNWTNSRSDAQGLVTLELGAPLSPGDECKTRTVDPARPCIQLRSPPGVKDAVLEDWFELIEEAVESSKFRRQERTASINRPRQQSSLTVTK